MESISPELLQLYREQEARAMAAAEEERQAKAARAERLQELISERSQGPASVDLSAAAAMADQMTGGNISRGVQAQQAGANQFQSRTDNLLDQLNLLKTGPAVKAPSLNLLKPSNEGGKDSRQFGAQTQQAFKDLAEQTRKISDSVLDAGSNANKMRAAFLTKDPRQVMPAMNELARTIQDVKGSMSEGDVNRSFFTDIETKVQIALTKVGADGQVSDEAIAPVLAQLDRFQTKVAEVAKKKIERVKTTYKGNPAYSVAVGQLEKGGAFDSASANVKEYSPPTEPVAPVVVAPAAMDPAARLAELRAKANATK